MGFGGGGDVSRRFEAFQIPFKLWYLKWYPKIDGHWKNKNLISAQHWNLSYT